ARRTSQLSENGLGQVESAIGDGASGSTETALARSKAPRSGAPSEGRGSNPWCFTYCGGGVYPVAAGARGIPIAGEGEPAASGKSLLAKSVKPGAVPVTSPLSVIVPPPKLCAHPLLSQFFCATSVPSRSRKAS